tara:strand:- start:270 stop:791 length:522 start_codon:yes stop_codon:yes gene_type:complete
MASANYDIPHEQGTNFLLNVNYYDDSGVAIDLSDHWARMDIRTARFEDDQSDRSVVMRFSNNNPHGFTGPLSNTTLFGHSGDGALIAGHISMNGEMIYGATATAATASDVRGQMSLSFTKEASRQIGSGTYLYDFLLFYDQGSSGSTLDAVAERLLSGKFVITPSISNPNPDA